MAKGTGGMFPKRFERLAHPDYPDLEVKVLANPIGALFERLMGSMATDAGKAEAGAALAEAYDHATYEAYGLVFDFSTPEAAVATIMLSDLPADLSNWLRNAPIDLVLYERDERTKNFKDCLRAGS